jgi:hypothetical protein
MALDVHAAALSLQGGFMRDSLRPILKLALFGTYTLVAIGISEVRTRLWISQIARRGGMQNAKRRGQRITTLFR